MKATLIDKMGSDLTVVNAARVSFAKKSKLELIPHRDAKGDLKHTEGLSERDAKLIQYLAKHNHWTPFGHCQAQFHVKAPIFVARQMVKHQIGLVWNEVSRRYVDDEVEYWYPDEWRMRAENKKQGSSDEVMPFDEIEQSLNGNFVSNCKQFCVLADDLYKELLERGVAPEMARIFLPLNMYTEWYWTGSLAAWARVCKLRLDPHAQKEAQDLAKDIDEAMRRAFPVSWAALLDEN